MSAQFQRVATGDRNIDQVQENVAKALKPLTACPLVDGREVGPLTFEAGVTQQVAHGLGKRASQVRFTVVSPEGVGHVYGSTPTDDRFLALTSDADLTTYLWVF